MTEKTTNLSRYTTGDLVRHKSSGIEGVILDVLQGNKYRIGFFDGQVFICNENDLVNVVLHKE